MKSIKKIVITGGPCAGKTSALNKIKPVLENMGYRVLIINEIATELMSSGITPDHLGSRMIYQKLQLKLQLDFERAVAQAAAEAFEKNTVILCDRGALDGKAYMDDSDFEKITRELGFSQYTLAESYDAVFFMSTSAKMSPDLYKKDGNPVRSEEYREAAVLDDLTLKAWTGHSHLRIIPACDTFEEKFERLKRELCFFLALPEPLEIERKYLIKCPDISLLEGFEPCGSTDITQTYAENASGRMRLRKRGKDQSFIYIKTIKENLGGIKRIEKEEQISEKEYLRLLKNADKSFSLTKKRYCLVYENQYFEIDIFPFSQKAALMEIELTDENQDVLLPPFIEVIKDVSEDKYYRNFNIAYMLSMGKTPF